MWDIIQYVCVFIVAVELIVYGIGIYLAVAIYRKHKSH